MQAAFINVSAGQSFPVCHFLVGHPGTQEHKGRTELALTAVSKVFTDNMSIVHQGAHLYRPTRKVPCRAFQISIEVLSSQLCIIYENEKQGERGKRERKGEGRHGMSQ